jgi:hypothetical protein
LTPSSGPRLRTTWPGIWVSVGPRIHPA